MIFTTFITGRPQAGLFYESFFKSEAMKKTNKINDIHEKIHLYLDSALDENDQQNLLEQMKDYPGFPQMINRERNFRTFLKNNVRRSNVPNDLIQSIINQIKLD